METIGIMFVAIASICAIVLLWYWTQDKYQDKLDPKDRLRKAVDKHKYVDVSKGAEAIFGVSETYFHKIIAELVAEGYTLHYVQVFHQHLRDRYSEVVIKALCVPGTTYSSLVKNREQIKPLT